MTVRSTLMALLVVVILTAANARADISLTPTIPEPIATGNETSEDTIKNIIETAYHVSMLYKADSGTVVTEAGPWASAYATTFSLDQEGEPLGGTVSWNGPGSISSNPVYFLVKDGSQTPAWYLYNISGWNGTDSIHFTDFWPEKGAISNVAIYGGTSVPEGGATFVLLGTALVTLGVLRRRLNA